MNNLNCIEIEKVAKRIAKEKYEISIPFNTEQFKIFYAFLKRIDINSSQKSVFFKAGELEKILNRERISREEFKNYTDVLFKPFDFVENDCHFVLICLFNYMESCRKENGQYEFLIECNDRLINFLQNLPNYQSFIDMVQFVSEIEDPQLMKIFVHIFIYRLKGVWTVSLKSFFRETGCNFSITGKNYDIMQEPIMQDTRKMVQKVLFYDFDCKVRYNKKGMPFKLQFSAFPLEDFINGKGDFANNLLSVLDKQYDDMDM